MFNKIFILVTCTEHCIILFAYYTSLMFELDYIRAVSQFSLCLNSTFKATFKSGGCFFTAYTKPDQEYKLWRHLQFYIKTNSVAFSPQANYIDWATATCRRNLMPTFVDRGMSLGQRGGSLTVVNLSFLDRSRYFPFKWLLIYPQKGWVDPVPDVLLLRKSGSVGNRTRHLWICSQGFCSLDQKGDRSTYKRVLKHSLLELNPASRIWRLSPNYVIF
jgi:hypothetical protein